MAVCFSCNKELVFSSDQRVGRKDECPHCSADMHVCLNCKFYDPQAYNECHEVSAERVLDKDRSNFCEYFSLGNSNSTAKKTSSSDTIKALDDLFKS